MYGKNKLKLQYKPYGVVGPTPKHPPYELFQLTQTTWAETVVPTDTNIVETLFQAA